MNRSNESFGRIGTETRDFGRSFKEVNMSSNVIPRHPALVLVLTVLWFVGLVIWSLLIAYVPGALHVVNDERWGRLIAKVLLPGLLPLFAASVQFARRKHISAAILAGVVILVLFGLDFAAISHAARH